MKNREENTFTLSGELKFLVACCQSMQCKGDRVFIIDHIADKTKEQYTTLISLAISHGILPLVYKSIKEVSAQNESAVPPAFLAELKALYMGVSQRNMLMSAELIRIMKLLKENDIEALAFKGPTLSQMAYGDITLRQYVDLDILVNAEDAFKAGMLFTEHGHRAVKSLSLLSNAICLTASKDFSFYSKSSNVHTELHWKLLEKNLNISIEACNSNGECQTVTINNHPIQTLQNDMLLVYLCVHGSKHAFERIEWISDIDRLIQSTNIDWEEAISIAENSRSNRSFLLALSLAHMLFKTELPSSIMKQISNFDNTLQHHVLGNLNLTSNKKSDFKPS